MTREIQTSQEPATGLTQAQLARQLGLSQATVSQAFRDDSRVGPATRRRVIAEARRLGYRPNAAARAARTRRFGAVALLYRQEQTFFPLDLVHGINRALNRLGMHLSCDELPSRSASRPESYEPTVLRQLCVDGFLVHHAIDIAAETISAIRTHHVPAVWINTRQPNDCVYPDEKQGMAAATAHLLQAGHRRIVYLSKDPAQRSGHFSSDDRWQGYAAAMRDAGLEPVGVHTPSDPATGALQFDAMAKRLAQPDRPTAVLANGTEVVAPLMVAAAHGQLRVPDHLSVLALTHDQPRLGLDLSVIGSPMASVGEEAVAMLHRKITGNPRRPSASVALPYGQVTGATVRPPTH